MNTSLKETEYDVLLIGTGIVEAIIAAALARIGKKVLHLDQNDYYGSNYASFTLDQFLRWMKNEAITPRNFGDDQENNQVNYNAGDASAIDVENLWILPMKSSLKCHVLQEGFADEATKEELLRQSSSFSIDVSPRLMLSSEQLVETLITSGVGRYLEFAAIERTYVHFQPSASGATQIENDLDPDTVWEVPCSKKDVFQSKLLGMVEKRQLMKFLQFVADYGETHILHEDVKTKNERTLALGRALKRPQNKMSQADGDAEIATYLECPFQELLEKHFKLSSKLQQVVVYCVGLATFPATKNQISARDGLAAVYCYVASIGRFTGTAFLAPLYGISELAQSFCRLCAVYGGVYVLRAPVDGFVLDTETNKISGVRCSDGGVLRTKHLVTNGSYVDCFRLTDGDTSTHVRGQILRGVFVLKTSLRDGMNRIMLVIPPEDNEFQNLFAIQVVQLDSGSCACPKGYFLVQISMPLPAECFDEMKKQQELMQSVIQRLILSSETELQQKQSKADVKSSSSPVMTNGATETEAATNVAQASDAKINTLSKPKWSDRIAWRAIFTMDHLALKDAFDVSANTKDRDLPANVWVCETSTVGSDCSSDTVLQKSFGNTVSPLEIHLESASANARAIFEVLCPGEPFLPKSASAQQAEQEEQESEEETVLRAAQKLAQQTQLKEEQTRSTAADSTTSQTATIVEDTIRTDEVARASRSDTANKEDDSNARTSSNQ
ncbi:unnamed protein product [Peronospora destructor]|uniref:Rab proteins geranylgeranyltransferase component n=1 Tax=Peronospora destructor TaxID=86335 RepID=A0AAV0T8P2_9STRA|nr:unnamed protein product [Peronospora destructor]